MKAKKGFRRIAETPQKIRNFGCGGPQPSGFGVPLVRGGTSGGELIDRFELQASSQLFRMAHAAYQQNASAKLTARFRQLDEQDSVRLP
jgi:hypothetical protein